MRAPGAGAKVVFDDWSMGVNHRKSFGLLVRHSQCVSGSVQRQDRDEAHNSVVVVIAFDSGAQVFSLFDKARAAVKTVNEIDTDDQIDTLEGLERTCERRYVFSCMRSVNSCFM